jgi:4-amino-4-deoxy-L-arabinose transferase-like glycosyltransferase
VTGRRAAVAGTVALLVYAAAALSLAARAHLWNDELYTWYIAQLPTMRETWAELSTGVEQVPPLFYVVTRASLAIFGDNAIALRMPSVLGLALGCACAWVVVARRTDAWYGFVAALIPLATGAFRYAWEARPYALLVGFAGLALLFHQLRSDGVRPRLAVVGLAFALAAATAVHYYGLLVVLPIAVAEAVRTSLTRRLDWPAIAALGAPLVPLAVALPLIEGARAYAHEFWTSFGLSSAPEFYVLLLRAGVLSTSRLPAWLALGFTAVVLVGAAVILVRRPVAWAVDVAAALGFVVLPLAGVLVAELVTGAYTERYVLPAVLGPAVLIPLALHRLAGGRGVAIVATAILAAWFGVLFQYWQRDVTGDLDRQAALIAFLDQTASRGGLPIAVGQPHDYFELAHYAPPSLAARLIRISSPRLAKRYRESRSSEDGLIVLSRFAPLHVVPYRRQPRSYLLLLTVRDREQDWNWIEPALRADGHHLQPMARDGTRGFALYKVEPASG